MKIEAIEKISVRIASAERAYDELCAAEAEGDLGYARFASSWFVYLTAWKGVYTALEQGSKGSPRSEAWFESAKQARLSNPLFAYLYHARNDEEHGLKRVAEPSPGTEIFRIPDNMPPDGKILPTYDAALGKMVFTGPDGNLINPIASTGPGFLLNVVRKRNGKLIGPPLFIGSAPDDVLTPIRAAAVGLDHVRQLLAEAAILV